MTSPIDRLRARQRRVRNLGNASAAIVVLLLGYATLHVTERGDEAMNRRYLFAAFGVVVLLLLLDELVPAGGTGRRERHEGSRFDRLARPAAPTPPGRPLGLKHAETSVELALRSARGRDRGLRASVRVIVDGCVPGAAARSLPGDPDPTRALDAAWVAAQVAPETWELIRPDRPGDVSRSPGIAPAELSRILDDLERL